MKTRLKSLVALILTYMICLQMTPISVGAEMSVSNTTYLLTEENLTDGYVLGSGGILRFDENLTVDGYVSFGYGSGSAMYLIIPSTSTMNGEITLVDGMCNIENEGTITSDLDLGAGSLTNSGKVSKVTVTNSGMLYAKSGSSYGELDISNAGSGMAVTDGTISIETLYLDPYALSVVDSSATQMNVSDLVSFKGTTALDDMYKVGVSDTTKISTEGQSDLTVWKDGIGYLLPAIAITEKTLGDIYSASIDKADVSYDEFPIGYQTSESATFTVTNDGLTDIILKFSTTGNWDTMFTVSSGGQTVTAASQLELADGSSTTLEVVTKKGLSVAAHEGVLSVQCCTSDGSVFATHEIAGSITVKKVPSIAVPSGDFYTLSGTQGKNGFYTSDVKVTPSDGYSIAGTLEDDFADTLTYTETVKKPTVYLQKDATGQITEKATLSEIKIDKEKPTIKNGKSGEIYYKKSISITVTDDNLSSVTLNDEKVAVADGKATVNINATDDKKKYTIRAEDLAGMTKDITFYLSPAWREEGTVPSGKSVKLYKNTKYSFGSGTWKVDGDPTSYAGGNSFYVADDGDFTMKSAD